MDLMTLALPQEPADGVAGWAADLVDTMGGPGAGLAIALENLFPPLPSEVILPLTGFAAGQGVIRERWPGVGVLVLSQHMERNYAAQLLTSSAERVGYLLKDRVAQVEEFLAALERIHAGGAAIDPEVVRQLVIRSTHSDPLARLTPRERSVLETLAQGHTNAAIAQKLHISMSTVEKNLNAIFDKLDLAHTTGYNRRILAVLRYLES